MARGADFLGSEWAILAGAMSWVSERNLVSAISNAGGFGVIACGAMTPELLDAEIGGTKALTAKPFGVNLITMHPQLFELIEVCGKHKVGHVVLAGGIPPKGSVEAIKASGAKVLCFAPTLALGKKLLRSGADALVIEGMEAGGHIGPVSTSVLAQEILPAVAKDIPVFVAGGIGRRHPDGCQVRSKAEKPCAASSHSRRPARVQRLHAGQADAQCGTAQQGAPQRHHRAGRR